MIKLVKGVLIFLLTPAAVIALGFALMLNAIYYFIGGDDQDDYSNQ